MRRDVSRKMHESEDFSLLISINYIYIYNRLLYIYIYILHVTCKEHLIVIKLCGCKRCEGCRACYYKLYLYPIIQNDYLLLLQHLITANRDLIPYWIFSNNVRINQKTSHYLFLRWIHSSSWINWCQYLYVTLSRMKLL